ncbi:MAG: cell wall-binding repeat-containing protein [Coriobacteriales bacterium]|jgi:putative cell wall-binding protein|nr:cell wall-binding repeat-containing protein [Coriobacteriales bacterium]
MRQKLQQKSKRVAALLLALSLALSLALPLAPAASALEEDESAAYWAVETTAVDTIYGGSFLGSDGSYQLAPDTTGVITLGDGVKAEVRGNGIAQSDKPNTNITFVVGSGATLTLNNVWLSCTSPVSAIDFKGGGTLYSKGQNLIEDAQDVGGSRASIHVGIGASASFKGDANSAFYLYKNRMGSGIGSNTDEQSGTMRFQSGNYFLKGTKVGAVIGNDSASGAGGAIYIEGGRLYVEANAMGAGIGASNQGIAGPVIVSGGQVYVWANWMGSAIGKGNGGKVPESAGTLAVSGGSIKTVLGANALNSGAWGSLGSEDLITDVAITARKTDGAGREVSRYIFSSLAYVNPGEELTVTIDGREFYSGTSYGYKYQQNTNHTPSNWVADREGTDLYFYLSKQTHTVEVKAGNIQLDYYDITWDAYTNSFSAPVPTKTWPRLDGNKGEGGNRYDTMQAIVTQGWRQGSGTVLVASGMNFPDALAASSLAGIYGAPVILTEPDALTAQAAETIQSLGASKAYIIGGEAAVSPQTFAALEGVVGPGKVVRISGEGRIETALDIYEKGLAPEGGLPSWGDTAIIANGFNFADALSVSPYAHVSRSPLFLSTPGSGLDVATLAAIQTGGFKKVIITGGTAAVPALVEAQLAQTEVSIERWSGDTRYETSVDIVERSLQASGGALRLNSVVCATGSTYPDALAGGTFAGHIGTVLLLVHGTEQGGQAGLALISGHRDEITRGYVLGGSAAVPEELLTLIEEGARG